MIRDFSADPPKNLDAEAARGWAEDALRGLGVSGPITWQALPLEASHRRFHRAVFPPGTPPGTPPGASGFPDGTMPTRVILMTSPPALEQNAAFERMARLFRSAGLSVPALFAVQRDTGWYLQEDLGAQHFADVYGTARERLALAASLESLLRLQRVADPEIAPYTRSRLMDELGVCTEWFIAGLLETRPSNALLEHVFPLLVDNAAHQPQCCIHRDWHCRNLLFTDDARVGIVDFQDALIGPACYDLASLLRDCYHAFPESTIAHWRTAWHARAGFDIDPVRLPEVFDLTAVQRQLKAIGIFARLHLRDGKATHLRWILPVLERLIALAHVYPVLAPLAAELTRLRPLAVRRLAAS
ncbi:MAG: aminoglycoside phosphotransferase family protein [Gammaproteobacteria bacterium]